MSAKHSARRPFRWLAAGTVAVTAIALGGARAGADPVPTVGGCGEFTVSQVGDFVAQWSVHLDDDAFMKSYLAGSGDVPASNASAADKACLIDGLAARLAQEHPGFGAGRDPQLVDALLGSVIFDRGKAQPSTDASTPDTSPAPATPLDGALDRLRAVLPSGVPSVTPDVQIGPTTTIGADAIVAAGPSATPLVTTHAGLTYTASDEPLLGLPSLPSPSTLLGLLGTILNSITYRVCTESATVTLKCSLPTPLAVPVLVDDTGDNLPDVSAALTPALTLTGGAQLQFSVSSLLAQPGAPAHVFAVFSVVGTSRQFAVGFDGRASHLGANNKMVFTLQSIARALSGDIDAGFKLTYASPGADTAVTFDVATVSGGSLTDPIDASLEFAPTPKTFTAGLRMQNTATPEYTASVQSSVPTTLTAHATIAQTAAGTETAFDGVVDQLPSSINVDVHDSGSAITADYSGSAKIDDLALAVRQVPDVTDPDTYAIASADLTQIPKTMHLVVTKPYDAVLSTDTGIGETTVSLRSVRDGVTHSEIYGDISNVPTNVHLHGDVTGAGNDFTTAFTYTADAVVPQLHFRLFDDQDLHAFVDATVADLPKYVHVSVAKHPHDSAASFDARTAESDAPGSASVGPITLKYTSTGTQLADADLPATDYVVLHETASDVQAALQYTGLSLASYALHDDVTDADHDTVTAELRNAGPRVVTLEGDTPALTVSSVIDALPADMTLDYAKQGSETDVHYHASAPISSMTAAVAEKSGDHASVGAAVTGVPDDVQIAMDQAAGTLDWTASGPVDSLGLSGQVNAAGRTWTGGATLADVPRSWSLGFGPSAYSFQAQGSVGSLGAYLTNHGSAPTESGNHAIANYDAGSGDLDASFEMSSVHAFSYTPSDSGFTATAQMGGGLPFHLAANLLLADDTASAQHLDEISADATIDPLPTSMTFSQQGTSLDYTSDTSPDIDAAVAIGRADAVAATPTPPTVRGVSLRDGRACDPSGCADADRIRLFLQGAPSGLHADLAKVDYGITHYAPPAGHNEFDADVVLDSNPDASKHLSALVTLGGIASSGQDMEIGPLTTVAGPVPDSETTTIAYHGNHAVGPLTASVVAGDKTIYATVSNLPTSMSFAATTRPDGMEFSGDLADQISSITAFYKPTGAANWALSASLHQLPQTFDFSQLTLGDQPSSDPCAPPPPHPPVPTVDYTASADTLDITATVDLGQLSSSLSGSITAGITDLGHDTHASWDGTKLTLTSVPQTASFEMHVPNATVSIHDDFDTSAPDPCHPSGDPGFISFSANGHLYVTAHIHDAGMTLTDVSSLTLTPGFSSAVQGNFGTFSFGWSGLSVDIDAALNVDVTIDFGGGISVSPTLASLDAVFSTVVHVDFGVYQQTPDTFLTIPTPVPCGIDPPAVYEVHVSITPDRVATGHDGFTVPGPTDATGDAWVITLNPFGLLPDTVLDAVTGLFTSPLSHGLDASFDCTDIF